MQRAWVYRDEDTQRCRLHCKTDRESRPSSILSEGENKRLEERCWNTWNQRSFPSKFSSREERRRSRILRDALTSSRVPGPSRIEEDWNAAYYKHRVISIQTLLIRVNFDTRLWIFIPLKVKHFTYPPPSVKETRSHPLLLGLEFP